MKYFITLIFTLTTGYWQTTFAQCSFSVSNTSPCASEEVNFSVDSPTPGANYTWDLDEDGQSDLSGSSFSYSFPEMNTDSTYTATLFEDGNACSTQDITALAVPDPSIGVPPGIVALVDNEIKACNGSSSFDLEIYNASSTFGDNASYTINWGDGTPAEDHDNSTFSNTSTISHTYNGLGYYTIFITATHQNGCVFTRNYTFYNGGNPSVGLAIPGNTVGLCAPATLDFPITNTEGNPPGTEYTVYISGEEVAHFTQEELPDIFTYTFLESSCGVTTSTGNYNNAFDIRIVASNPCNSSTATIEPIEVSEPPEPFFDVTQPAFSCAGAIYGFENNTTNISEVVAGNPSQCIDVLNPTWTISGTSGEDWNVVSGNLFGSNTIEIEFLNPGVYVIEMKLVSFACGPVSFSQEITIQEPPEAGAAIQIPGPGGNGNGGCTPLTIPFSNNSAGENLSFEWAISPGEGWSFVDSTHANSASPVVEFTEGGVYDIQLLVANSCAEVSWDTTLLMPGPPNIELAPIPDFCQSATLSFDSSSVQVQLNGLAAGSYNWSFPGGQPEASGNPFPENVQYDSAGTYTVILQLSNACGETTAQDTFTVQEPGPLAMPPDMVVCNSDAPFMLEADPPGGAWSGSGVSENGRFDPATASPGSHILQYSYGVGACSMAGSLTVTVLQATSVDAGPGQEVCSNEPAVPLNGTPAGGSWAASGNAVLSGNSFIPSESGAGTYTLIYSITDGNNCTVDDSLSITVLPAPQINVADTAYCNTPGAVPLPLAAPSGGQWSGAGVTNPTAGLFDPFAAGGAGSYQLTYSLQGNNGCTSSETVNIGVIDPSNADAGPNQSLCISDSPLNLGPLANPPGGAWSGPALNGSVFTPSLAGGGSFMITYQVGAGNCAVEDSLLVEVLDPGPVEAGPAQQLCLNDSPVALSDAMPTGGQWAGTGISGNLFDPEVAGEGAHSLIYTFSDGNSGCSRSDTLNIEVLPLPTAAFVLPGSGCRDEELAFTNQSEGAVAFHWDFGDGSSSQEEAPGKSYANTGAFTIRLTISNQAGCQSFSERELEVIAPPEAQFDPGMEAACGSQEVLFTNQSLGDGVSFHWDFGNGESSNLPQPDAPVFYQVGVNDTTYTATLTAENQCGMDIYRDTLFIEAFPVASFGFAVDTGCAPLLVEFANVSIGSPDNFYWDLGNGQAVSDSLPPPQLYAGDTIPVNYTITLVTENNCGADTLEQVLTVEPEVVNAFLNASNTRGCAPFEVAFENYSTPGAHVSWDFGDGNGDAAFNPVHTFQNPGVYEVELFAANACAEDSTTIQVEVLPAPEVDFEYSPNLCTDQPVNFTNRSEGIAGSFWQFSTGDSSTLTNPTFSFPSAGTYTVTLTGISQANACPATVQREIHILEAPTAAFHLPEAEGCTPLAVQINNQSTGGDYFEWNFGDGNSSVQPNPVHTFTEPGSYEVQLSVFNAAGCRSDSIFSGVFAFPVPEAAFEIEKEEPCGLPANIHFNNTSAGAQGYTWNLGLPSLSPVVNPVQEYTAPGDYEITLIASNTYGCADTVQQPMRLYDKPIADFALDSARGCQPLLVSFANYSRGNTFLWDFGDGFTSTRSQEQHLYTAPGLFDVTLTVGYDSLCYDTLQLPALVEVLEMPEASFEWTEERINGGATGTINFINTSFQAGQYFWDFGDGAYSQEENPVHRYHSNGAYEVLLTAVSDGGCRDDTLVAFRPGLIKGLYVPNAFAPGQGNTDARLFLPKGIGLKEYQMQVFSPYGQLLWESSLLRNGQPAEGWDGTFNGALMPQDVYVWKAQAIFEDETLWRGNEKEKNRYQKLGSVTLIR
ncbi:MAG: PKD domain-containing protein [Lewinellaceae bacterium]|nr:PKD domain-containing protein [Lewinellaceae bacterium]